MAEHDGSFGPGNIIAQFQYDYQNADTTCDWSSVGTTETSGVAIEINEETAAGDSLASVYGNLVKRRFKHLLNR